MEQALCRYLVCDEQTLIESGYQAMYRSGSLEAAQALDAFREALRRDPASSDRWCDLAAALAQYGRTKEAGYCYDRALQLAPNSPQVWLRAANFSFSIGENQKALGEYARVVQITPVYEPVVFSYYGLMDLPVSEILERGIPADRGVAQAYFLNLLGAGTEPDVKQAWRWMTARAFLDDRLAGQYAEHLLGRGKYEDAAAAWRQYLGKRAATYMVASYLYNGDFEEQPTGSVFDWRLSRADGIKLGLDEKVVHSGQRSLKVDLEGIENLAFGHVAQRAVIREGAYRLRGYMKTEGLTTNRGMALRVFDVESPGRLDVRTEEVSGSSDWNLLEKTFTVSRGTRLIEVQLAREPSLKFDNKIQGTLWLDSVTLERLRGRDENPPAITAVPRHE